MRVIRGIDELEQFLATEGCEPGCLADTGFLYAASFMDDRVYQKAIDAFDLFAEFAVSIYANVITRMEFIDLVFRKQLTIGAVELAKCATMSTTNKGLVNLLRNIQIQDAAHKNRKQSYKISEGRLKDLREEFELAMGPTGWLEFCAKHSGDMLFNEWEILEEDLGLNFIEVMEGQTSDIVNQPLHWSDMVRLVGKRGVRGPDAMTTNLFLKSRLPLLVTTDSDIVSAIDPADPDHANKTVLHLE